MNWITFWNRIFLAACVFIIAALAVYIVHEKSEREIIRLTSEEREWLDSHDGEITVGADIDYTPMDFINRWGEHDGLSEDYFRLIEEKLNVRFKRVNAPSWNELLEMTKKGEVDVVKCIVRSPEREEYLRFTQPYITIPIVIVTAGDSHSGSLTLEDLPGKTTVVTEGYYIHEFIRDNHKGISVLPAKTNLRLFELVSTGEAQYALTDLPTVTYFVKKLGITNLNVAGQTGVSYRLAAAVRKDLPLLNSALSKAVDSITDRERETIEKRWISVEYNRYLYSKGIFIAIIAGFTAVIGIIIIISVWNKSLHLLVNTKTEELNKYKDTLEELVEERTRQLREANNDLSAALANVKTLKGLLPICANCKKIRNDKGYWEQIDQYVSEHTGVDFSHGLCPDCAAKLYPDLIKKGEIMALNL